MHYQSNSSTVTEGINDIHRGNFRGPHVFNFPEIFSLIVVISEYKLADFPLFHCLCFHTKASVVLSSYMCIPMFLGLCRLNLSFPVIYLLVCKIFRIPHTYCWYAYVTHGVKNF